MIIYISRVLRKFEVPKTKHMDIIDFEEGRAPNFIDIIGAQAATNAINENKALNLPYTILEDGWVVDKMPDGTTVRIEIAPEPSTRKLAKGTVLHVKHKH